ncbi:MAG: sulfatase family protein, partial [Planctomycetota bacterium]
MRSIPRVTFFLLILTAASFAFAGDRPNFVFFIADDCNYNEIGAFGGQNAKTPHLDRLAAQGMRFTQAYAATAMCAPFRAELYTGLYPMRNGVAWNHSSARPGTKSVVHHLEALGYRVGLTGKKHASPASVFPFANVRGFPDRAGVRNFIKKDADQPFCLFICSSNPHAAWTTGDASKFTLEDIRLAPTQHDSPELREAMTRYYAEVEDLDREAGLVMDMLDEMGVAENTMLVFSSEQGWALGFAKWSNYNLGVHTGLIVRWPGKIEPGVSTDALVQMTDVVPTLVEAAGGDPAPLKLDGSSFLNVLLGKTDTHRRYAYGQHNNVPEGNPYPIRSIRDGRFSYLVNLAPQTPYHEKHVMVENSRLVWWPAMVKAAAAGDARARTLMDKYQHRPGVELYDTLSDPYETINLAGNPA